MAPSDAQSKASIDVLLIWLRILVTGDGPRKGNIRILSSSYADVSLEELKSEEAVNSKQ